MSLPLNGFHPDHEKEQIPYSLEQPDRPGPEEDWPDWSDPEENKNRDRHSVQIHIRASERGDPMSSRLPLSHTNMEEDPWEDFEDTELTSDLSPTTTQSEPVILKPPRGSTTTTLRQAPEALRLCSKPLKLQSALREPTENKITSSLDNSWAQEERDSEKSPNPLNLKAKPGVPQKNIGGLGEEFTIKVKKKVEQDPELDFFADMVPDIKLSSLVLLPLDGSSVSSDSLSATSSENIKSLKLDSAIDTLTLTAKFAAANLTEVSVKVFSLDFFHISFDGFKKGTVLILNVLFVEIKNFPSLYKLNLQ